MMKLIHGTHHVAIQVVTKKMFMITLKFCNSPHHKLINKAVEQVAVLQIRRLKSLDHYV